MNVKIKKKYDLENILNVFGEGREFKKYVPFRSYTVVSNPIWASY